MCARGVQRRLALGRGRWHQPLCSLGPKQRHGHFANGPKTGWPALAAFLSTSTSRLTSTAVFTWGVGTEGQLGHQKFQLTTQSMFEGQSYIQEEPRKLIKSKKFTQLAIGERFTLGLSQTGEIYGWGAGFLGSESASNEPVVLPLPNPAKKIVAIAAGSRHAAAIDSDGQVLTWGFGGDWYKGGGQLGHGSTEAVDHPKYVDWIRDYGVRINAVTCGNSHTIFLTDDGEVLTCGVGEYGRLGIGGSSNAELPASIEALISETVVQVTAGNSHSIALTKSGKMYTWGRNDAGQLGHADSYIDIYSMEEFPRLIESPFLEGHNIIQVAAGNRRCVAISREGSLFIWGNRLQHFPTLVDRSSFDNLRVVSASCGGNQSNSCTAIVTEDGGLWTMGDASSKILGRKGAKGKQASPVRVGGPGAAGAGASTSIGLQDKRVLSIASGLGMHMAAIVEVPE